MRQSLLTNDGKNLATVRHEEREVGGLVVLQGDTPILPEVADIAPDQEPAGPKRRTRLIIFLGIEIGELPHGARPGPASRCSFPWKAIAERAKTASRLPSTSSASTTLKVDHGTDFIVMP